MKKLSLVLIVILSIVIFAIGKINANSDSVKFYSPQKGIYVADINFEVNKGSILPYVSDSLETVENIAKKTNSPIAINAGFFDPTNIKTTSYILQDGEVIADPTLNPNLMNNPNLNQYLESILNRSEFRILSCENNETRFQIAQHKDSLPNGCKIVHSIQAGPELVPDLKLQEEAFVVKQGNKIIKQSAGALGKYARSAIGIKDQHVLLVAVSNEAAMTLKELAEFMKSLKVDQAIAFDGGSSTSLYVNLPEYDKFVLTSAKDNAARRIKSAILYMP